MKELLDTLRDRKTLIFMVALPLLLIPGLITVMVRLAASEERKTRERLLVVQAEPDERARRAIDLSIEKYCSVMHSLAPDIRVTYDIDLGPD